jgi:predicted PurR-regulated permease PerM
MTKPDDHDHTAPSMTARNALVILAVIACGAAFKWLTAILTPLVLALFLMVMIDGLVRLIRRRVPSLPGWAATSLALTVFVGGFFGMAVYVAENASSFAVQMVDYTPRLNGLLKRLSDMVGLSTPATIDQLFRQLDPTQYLGDAASALQHFASDAVLVLIYLGFLIASRRGFAAKTESLFPSSKERADAVRVFLRIRDGIEGYLWIQTTTGLMIAAASWAIMAAIGLDQAFFWAFLIFVVSYVPIIGGAIAIMLPPLFALVQFPTLWPAIILLGALQAINFVVGNVILPRLQGDSLNIDPVVVLLALAFWGAIWGLPGMFLSTPLTVMAMVILAQFKGSHWIAVLLSSDGDPLGEDHTAITHP